MNDEPARYRVITSHTASHPDPVRLKTGDEVTVGRRDERWTAFFWCTSTIDGREGWVPEEFLEPLAGETLRDGARAVAQRAYDANELSASEGQEVTVVERAAGWARCLGDDGDDGWVPEEDLEAV